MLTIAGIGDKTSHNGRIITGSLTRKIQGRFIARLGDMVTCPIHGRNPITEVLPIMPFTDGLPTAHAGARTRCGARILPAPHIDVQGPSS